MHDLYISFLLGLMILNYQPLVHSKKIALSIFYTNFLAAPFFGINISIISFVQKHDQLKMIFKSVVFIP